MMRCSTPSPDTRTGTPTHTPLITPNFLQSLLEADILLHTPGLQSLCCKHRLCTPPKPPPPHTHTTTTISKRPKPPHLSVSSAATCSRAMMRCSTPMLGGRLLRRFSTRLTTLRPGNSSMAPHSMAQHNMAQHTASVSVPSYRLEECTALHCALLHPDDELMFSTKPNKQEGRHSSLLDFLLYRHTAAHIFKSAHTLFVLDEWVCPCLQQSSHRSCVHVARCHMQGRVACREGRAEGERCKTRRQQEPIVDCCTVECIGTHHLAGCDPAAASSCRV
jgi:hypothetical protein